MRFTIALPAAVLCAAALTFGSASTLIAAAQAPDAVKARVAQQRQPLLDTMRELVSIESGSTDADGLAALARVIEQRLRALGGDVQIIEPPSDHIRFETTPPRVGRMVMATFTGTGTRRILLIA